MKRCIAVAALVLSLPAQADIYKCMINGTTTYQDWPCDEAQELHRLENNVSTIGAPQPRFRLAEQHRDRVEQRQLEAELAREKARVSALKEQAEKNRYESARAQGRVIPGMTEGETRLIYGRPERTERDGICKVLKWHRPYHWVRICRNEVVESYY